MIFYMRMSHLRQPSSLPVTKCHAWHNPHSLLRAWRNYWMTPWWEPNQGPVALFLSGIFWTARSRDHAKLTTAGITSACGWRQTLTSAREVRTSQHRHRLVTWRPTVATHVNHAFHAVFRRYIARSPVALIIALGGFHHPSLCAPLSDDR